MHDPNYKPKSIGLSTAVEQLLTENINSVQTLSMGMGDTLLVGMAKCCLIPAGELGRMLDELFPRFKGRILIYPADELEFKKIEAK